MQLAFLSDIHANLEALDAVLDAIDRRAPGARIVCAGDVVGGGPDPEACLQRLLEREALIVRGNHEELVLGWREEAKRLLAVHPLVPWTRGRLSLRALTQLAALPPVADAGHGVIVCHGDLDDTGTSVVDAPGAAHALARLGTCHPAARMLVCGHAHRAMYFSFGSGLRPVYGGVDVDVGADGMCLVNPGAVGQARERAPLASYAVYDVDQEVLSFWSVRYDHETTLAKLAGLRPGGGLLSPRPGGPFSAPRPGGPVPALRPGGPWASVALMAQVVLSPPRGGTGKVARLWRRSGGRVSAAERPALVVDGDTSGAGAPVFPIPQLKRRLLAKAQGALHATGVSSAFLRLRALQGNAVGALILTYHSITSSAEVPFIDPRYAVPLAVFERQMQFLAAHRRVLAMSDLVDRLTRGASVPAGSVVITFDDGYLDTLRVAAPVLDRLGLEALVYLPTGQISRAQSQFIDVLHGAFALRTRHVLDVPQAGIAGAQLLGREEVQRVYAALGDRLSTMTLVERSEVLAVVVDQLRPSRPLPRLTMNWDDVLKLRDRHGFDIGVHTRNHLDLTACGPEQVRQELSSCIADVHTSTGRAPEHFAYPYGRCSPQVRDDVAALPLRSAVITEPGLASPGADMFTLPRLTAPRSMELFPFFTSGAYPDLSRTLLQRI